MNFWFFLKDKHEYDAVFVVIDWLKKKSYFISCIKKITVKDMTRMYINYIYHIYESSDSAVSDQDSQFISAFWDEFCKILDVKLKLSTVNHSQTDE